MIRVLIVDDHAVVRLGLNSYLSTEPDIDVVGEAQDGVEAVDRARALRPDVIVMDLLMPRKNGVEATQEITEVMPQAKVIVLTSSLEDAHPVQAVRAGACGYLLKTTLPKDVANAIRAAFRGESVVDPSVAGKLMGALRAPTVHNPVDDLTAREQEVLKGIATGKSNQEIADTLGIGVKTVKTHVSNILLKLDVMDRTQAAIYAIRHGLD